ncbi:hypothetical protein [Haloferula sargassicola]|uniref:DUF202 domain-containing protein n=1 Tax=Haloferula sargassicola TaxID=490096 RepID=A0ABP9ULA9_9BACT
MNRLTRIAVTLFASATVLIVLAKMRLARVVGLDPDSSAEFIANETRMAELAVGIAGLLVLAAASLIVVRLVGRGRNSGNP